MSHAPPQYAFDSRGDGSDRSPARGLYWPPCGAGGSGEMMPVRWTAAIGALVLMLPACHRLSEGELVDRERSYRDASMVCGRVHDLMKASEPGRIYADLPGVAHLVERTYSTSGPIQDCGNALLAWIERAVAARPLDLRPRLVAQVTALGPFVASGPWHIRARELLAGLLLDRSPRQMHWREEFHYLGPGSQRVSAGHSAIVGLDEIDQAAAEALAHGYVRRAIDDGYADFLAEFFARRFAEAQPRSVLPDIGMPASLVAPWWPPPDPDRVGEGHGVLDMLWRDLGRAYRRDPTHPRWQPLPATLRLRLSEQRPLLLTPAESRP